MSTPEGEIPGRWQRIKIVPGSRGRGAIEEEVPCIDPVATTHPVEGVQLVHRVLGKVRREKFDERIDVETAGHDGAAQADQSKLLFRDVSFSEVRKVAGPIEPGGVADGCGQLSGQGVGTRLGFHWMAPFSRAFCSIARSWGTIFSSDFRCRSNSRQPTKSVLAGAGIL